MATPRTARPGMLLDPADPINRGLAGFWPMWEGAGGKCLDIAGKNNHGALTNGPVWADGLKFDGTDDYVKCGTMGKWGSSRANGFSLAFSVNPETTSSQAIFGQIEAGNGKNGLSVKVNTNSANAASNGSIRIGLVDNAATPVALNAATNTDKIPRNAWTNIVVTALPSNANIKIYINGAEHSVTYGAGNVLTNFADLTYENYLGCFNSTGTASGFFAGGIRGFAAWTRVLSALEAQQLHVNPNFGLWVPDTTRYYIPAAGGGFQPAWAANSNVLLGGGMAL